MKPPNATKLHLISFMLLVLVVYWPSVGLSGVKALLDVKLAQLSAGAKADEAFKTAMSEAEAAYLTAIIEAGATLEEASAAIAKLQHKAKTEVALQTALYKAGIAYKDADTSYKAAIAEAVAARETAEDKAETTWKSARDEAGTETLDKTGGLIGEADAIYTAATVNAEAELDAAMKEGQATFNDDVIDVNKLEERIRAALKEGEAIFDDDVIGYETLLIARKAIAALARASVITALDAYLADVAKARVAYMAAIIEAMQARNHLLKP